MVRVAVIGCGLLGIKIAGEFAYHGHRVKCYDNNIQSLNSVYARYQKDKEELYADQVIESPNFTGQVLCLSRLEETVNDAQIVIECVVEDFDVKSVLLEKISSLCPPDCIITTNTLRLDISKLAERVKKKERFCGLRFLYPVYYIAEVEFTPHKETGNWLMENLRNLLSQMNKTLFFRSGSEPLILSEEKREARKKQRIEELRLSNGLPPIMRQESNVPELGRNSQIELHNLFQRRNQDKDFSSFGDEKKLDLKNKTSKSIHENHDIYNQDSDCAICMDKKRNSVLRPCNHMITCFECSKLLLNRVDNCPVCREKIDDVIRIFMS
jgi:hypothetical protein